MALVCAAGASTSKDGGGEAGYGRLARIGYEVSYQVALRPDGVRGPWCKTCLHIFYISQAFALSRVLSLWVLLWFLLCWFALQLGSLLSLALAHGAMLKPVWLDHVGRRGCWSDVGCDA